MNMKENGLSMSEEKQDRNLPRQEDDKTSLEVSRELDRLGFDRFGIPYCGVYYQVPEAGDADEWVYSTKEEFETTDAVSAFATHVTYAYSTFMLLHGSRRSNISNLDIEEEGFQAGISTVVDPVFSTRDYGDRVENPADALGLAIIKDLIAVQKRLADKHVKESKNV